MASSGGEEVGLTEKRYGRTLCGDGSIWCLAIFVFELQRCMQLSKFIE